VLSGHEDRHAGHPGRQQAEELPTQEMHVDYIWRMLAQKTGQANHRSEFGETPHADHPDLSCASRDRIGNQTSLV
jgi:hypothetical protein